MYRALPVGIAAVVAVLLLLGNGPRPAEAATTVFVTNNNNAGPGSFRAAVDQANANPYVGVVKFLVTGPINLQSAVVYTNSQPLTLSGFYNTVIQGSAVRPVSVSTPCTGSGLFTSDSAADLTILNLTFQNATCGSGVRVNIPDSGRTVAINLNGVVLKNNSEYGLRVNVGEVGSCTDADAEASINLSLWYTSVTDNGDNGVSVVDDGDGSVSASLNFSEFLRNKVGVGLRETCEGNLSVTANTSSFNENHHGLVGAESDEGAATLSLTAFDALRNDHDGVSFTEDDGGNNSCTDGNLDFAIAFGRANDNGDHGVDVHEEDCGAMKATINGFTASNNGDDGI